MIGTVKDINKVYETLNEVKAEFKANEYSLIHKNCNHFAEELCLRLLGKALPSYINRLARMGTWVSFLLPQSLKSLNPIPDSGSSPTNGTSMHWNDQRSTRASTASN